MTPLRRIRPSLIAASLLLAACGGNPRPGVAGGGDPCAGAWVQLYDDANFSNRRLTIEFPGDARSLVAAGIDSDAGHLNDRASSAIWSIPVGCQLILYEDENFAGTRFQLVGSGRTERNPNLGSFSDRASSARWERT